MDKVHIPLDNNLGLLFSKRGGGSLGPSALINSNEEAAARV